MEGNERPLQVTFSDSSFTRNLALNRQVCIMCLCAHPYISNLLILAADLNGHYVKFTIDGCLEHLNKQANKPESIIDRR